MKFKLNLHSVNLGLFIIFLFLTLTIDNNPPIWENFGDPYSYMHQSKISFFNKDFFFTPKIGPYSPVPFTVPLIYKIVGNNPEQIIQTQKLIHWLSVFFLAYAMVLITRNKIIGLLSILLLYLVMSWWNMLGWTLEILSESLQLSIFLCWIASLILIYKKKSIVSFLVHVLFLILLAGTRDQWPYLLLLSYLLLSACFFFINRKFLPKVLILLGLGIGIFFIQQHSSNLGCRSRKPVINSILFRIMKNPKHYDWFRKQGMPQADKLLEQFSSLDIYNYEHHGHVFQLYTDPEYEPFRQWIDKYGVAAYKKFMLCHPSYFFFMLEKNRDLNRLFAINLYPYTGPPKGYTCYLDKYFPLFHPAFLVFLLIILIILLLRTREFWFFIPILLIVITAINIFLMYNADAMEVERHSILTMISVQVIGVLSLAMIIDRLWPLSISERNNKAISIV